MQFVGNTVIVPDQVFMSHSGVWKVAHGGDVLPQEYNDYLEAQRALKVLQEDALCSRS